jgi:indolepyruvate decarboxylase
MNLTESLLHALKAHGARQIFGIPGDFALPYFRIIEESQILPLYTLSHEPGVGFAADACARIGGGLGVAAVTYGAGALNMVNAVASAAASAAVLPAGPASWNPLRVRAAPPGRDAGLAVRNSEITRPVRLADAARAPVDVARGWPIVCASPGRSTSRSPATWQRCRACRSRRRQTSRWTRTRWMPAFQAFCGACARPRHRF